MKLKFLFKIFQEHLTFNCLLNYNTNTKKKAHFPYFNVLEMWHISKIYLMNLLHHQTIFIIEIKWNMDFRQLVMIVSTKPILTFLHLALKDVVFGGWEIIWKKSLVCLINNWKTTSKTSEFIAKKQVCLLGMVQKKQVFFDTL